MNCKQCDKKLYKPRYQIGLCSTCKPDRHAKSSGISVSRTCAACNKAINKRSHGTGLCSICVRKRHTEHNDVYTSSDFNLSNLSYEERCLVFMWAAGVDISTYFDPRQISKWERAGTVRVGYDTKSNRVMRHMG
jgi:hypothetical protein